MHYITFLKYMLPFSKNYFRLLYFHEISLYIVETCLYKCLGNCPPRLKKRGGREQVEDFGKTGSPTHTGFKADKEQGGFTEDPAPAPVWY